VHGLAGGPFEVQPVAEALAAAGATVVVPRLPGHEGGLRPLARSTHADWRAAVAEARTQLLDEGREVDLLGFSTGAPLVLAELLRRPRDARPPEAVRVALLAPFVRIYRPPRVPLDPARLALGAPRWLAAPRPGPPLPPGPLRRAVLEVQPTRLMPLAAVRSALELIAEVEAGLERISARAWLIQGRRDTVVDPEGAEAWARRLPGTERLVHVDAAGHLLAWDAGRAEVEAASVEALAP
jgi:carboxylesterase